MIFRCALTRVFTIIQTFSAYTATFISEWLNNHSDYKLGVMTGAGVVRLLFGF